MYFVIIYKLYVLFTNKVKQNDTILFIMQPIYTLCLFPFLAFFIIHIFLLIYLYLCLLVTSLSSNLFMYIYFLCFSLLLQFHLFLQIEVFKKTSLMYMSDKMVSFINTHTQCLCILM